MRARALLYEYVSSAARLNTYMHSVFSHYQHNATPSSSLVRRSHNFFFRLFIWFGAAVRMHTLTLDDACVVLKINWFSLLSCSPSCYSIIIFVFTFLRKRCAIFIFVQFLDKDWQWTNRCLRLAPQSNRSRFTRLSSVRLRFISLSETHTQHTHTRPSTRTHRIGVYVGGAAAAAAAESYKRQHTRHKQQHTHSTFDCVSHNCHSSMYAMRESLLTLSNWIESIGRRSTFISQQTESIEKYAIKFSFNSVWRGWEKLRICWSVSFASHEEALWQHLSVVPWRLR